MKVFCTGKCCGESVAAAAVAAAANFFLVPSEGDVFCMCTYTTHIFRALIHHSNKNRKQIRSDFEGAKKKESLVFSSKVRTLKFTERDIVPIDVINKLELQLAKF